MSLEFLSSQPHQWKSMRTPGSASAKFSGSVIQINNTWSRATTPLLPETCS